MAAVAYCIVCWVSLVLVILPAPLHYKNLNSGTLLFIVWCAVGDLIHGINSLIWANTVDDRAPVWCDISTKLDLASGIGRSLALLGIIRYLARIVITCSRPQTVTERQRSFRIDLLFGLSIPCLFMAWHIIVQGHRYDIVSPIGCLAPIYPSWPAVLLFYIWIPIFSIASSILAARVLYNLARTGKQWRSILEGGQSRISISRFVRLIVFTLVVIGISLGLSSYDLRVNLRGGLLPYPSWSFVHEGFGAHTATQLHSVPVYYWNAAIGSLLFFAFFGTNKESLENYKQCISWIRNGFRHLHRVFLDKWCCKLPSIACQSSTKRDPRDEALMLSHPSIVQELLSSKTQSNSDTDIVAPSEDKLDLTEQ